MLINKIDTLSKKNLLKKMFFFIPLYGILKLSSFSAPLLLSNFSTKIEYGQFEYAFSLGVVIGVLFDFGSSASYPFFILKEKRVDLASIFKLYLVSMLSLCFFLVTIVHYLQYLNDTYYLSVLIAIVWHAQMFLSSIFKTNNQAFKAILIDSLFFLLINSSILFIYIFNFSYNVKLIIYVLSLYIIIIILSFSYSLLKNKPAVSVDISILKEVFKVSFPFLFNAFLMMFLANCARILIENYCGLLEVANFSFLFRISYIVLAIYQVFNIFFFSRVYLMQSKELDNWFLILALTITAIAVIVFVGTPFFAPFFSMLNKLERTEKRVFFILCSYAILWVISALNEGVLGREGMLYKSNNSVFILIIIFILSINFIDIFTEITPNIIAIVNFIILSIVIQSQFYWLGRKKVFLFKIRLFSILITILSATIYCFL